MKVVKAMVCVLAMFALVPSAFAHVHLKSSNPADKSELGAAPKELKLVFEDAVQLTAVKLTPAGGKVQALAPLPKETVKEVALPLPALKSGDYVVNWRAAGHDGHVMSGQVKFKVK